MSLMNLCAVNSVVRALVDRVARTALPSWAALIGSAGLVGLVAECAERTWCA